MIAIETLTYNPYKENTLILYNAQNECIIVDPGMHNKQEEQHFLSFISNKGLKPVLLLNTHCHVDHVLGNKFVYDNFGLMAQFHEGEIPVLLEVQNYAPQMGFNYDAAPIAEQFLSDKDIINFGDETLEVVLAPGHSPAHLCFYSAKHHFLIGGDVLFRNSIGRTDLPGGNHSQLLQSIKERIYSLPDNTTVYPGHGPTTTIGFEKTSNPFIQG
ncbi:MBL fold metallo-hydrolase [Sphingobacterium chungjuense]|uniref:MBL fold metallo-hydrolase n=1 Tax=Sphingobacterium chungjuense TaxID=2675553 RepID=UPI00140C2126|nr:MBL fold metallo-hydrolase [Sphingobacterium chungjuense]